MLIDDMRDLINTRGVISERDIMRVFGSKLFGGKLVYDRGVTDNRHNFKLFLNEFNIRKQLLDAGDIEGLVKRISREAYDRFYNKAKLIIDSYL